MKAFLKELLPYLLVILFIVLIKKFIVTPILVKGPSMENTLKNGDIMLLNKISRKYERFDIVVIRYNNELIIKRIIGLPGDEIEYIDDKLYVNGKYILEKFNHSHTDDIEKIRLDSKSYYVLGDNRVISNDSRFIGNFTKSDIVGKANFILFPFSRFGRKE